MTPEINPYVYVMNDPVDKVDPTGLKAKKKHKPNAAQKAVARALSAKTKVEAQKADAKNKLAKLGFSDDQAGIQEFQRTHLSKKHVALKPGGSLDSATRGAINWWANNSEARNDYFQRGGDSGKRNVAVYGVMDDPWNTAFGGKTTNLIPGKAAIRRRFKEVNDRGFPGNAKFSVYDIELKNGWGDEKTSLEDRLKQMKETMAWERADRSRDMAKFQGYEVMAGFLRYDSSADAVGAAKVGGDALVVQYQQSHFDEAQTLAHELGHVFGADHHEDPTTGSSEGCDNKNYCNNVHHGGISGCLMTKRLQSTWPSWCAHHDELIAHNLGKKGW